MTSSPAYDILLSEDSFRALLAYKAALGDKTATPGMRLESALAGRAPASLTSEEFLGALLTTKQPRIFAESEILGDGSDWTPRELSLLGDVNVGMRAEIYDNGTWSPRDAAFREHDPPLRGLLLFTPGPLMGGAMKESPDYAETVREGNIDQLKYNALIERRLLPVLAAADAAAAADGTKAFVTLPGIGCGAFAGGFKDGMGAHLDKALRALLDKHGAGLTHIKAVYFAPFAEGADAEADFHGIAYRQRSAVLNPAKPQLCAPQDYAENGEDLSRCLLCKIVAWDHASLPGNDFFAGDRITDDGVAAAATDCMKTVTGLAGHYADGRYGPPPGYKTWEDVVERNGVSLVTKGNVKIVAGTDCLELSQYEQKNAATGRPGTSPRPK
jgi:hypothetical protein